MASAMSEGLALVGDLVDERPSALRRDINVLHRVLTEVATRLEGVEQFARDAAEHTAPAPSAVQEPEQTGA